MAPIIKPIVTLENYGLASSLIRANRGILGSILGIVYYSIHKVTHSYKGVMALFLVFACFMLLLSLRLH